MQNISQVTFHNIYELAKSQVAWNEIKATKSVSKQTHWDIMSTHSVEENYCRSLFMPFNKHIISQIIDRFIKHKVTAMM